MAWFDCLDNVSHRLLRQVAVDGSKTYFDTNVSDHHHFFVEGENAHVDIPNAEVMIVKGAGHIVQRDKPETVDQIAKFLTGNSGTDT